MRRMLFKVDMRHLLLLFCLASAPVLAAEYKYVSYVAPDFYDDGRESFTLNTSAQEIISADAIETITICDDKSKFYCFHNMAVSFYVPKESISIGQTWVGNGVTFRALRKQPIKVFGVASSVWVVEAVRPERTDFFYYSQCDGLLAIKHVSKRGLPTQLFMTSERTGFPMQ